MLWLVRETVRRARRRSLLGALSVAFPVAILAATLLFVAQAVREMTQVSLEPVQVEMRALATTLTADMGSVNQQLATVPGVRSVDRFASADVIVRPPGGRSAGVTARLFAIDPAYLHDHPWVKVSGSLGHGALLSESARAAPQMATAKTVSISLPGGRRPLASLPVAGTADLRQAANTWFAIPTGEVQGDVAQVPRSLVVDYATFEKSILPGIKQKLGTATPVLNQGLADLPPVTLESHIAVDHGAYPSDPGAAARWSTALKTVLGRQAPGTIVVADNTVQPLQEASADSTNAKILFILLGIPGFLAAAALGFAAQSALTEAHRREDALLTLRGATSSQLARLAVGQSAMAGAVGGILGLAAAAGAVSAVDGHAAWQHVPAGDLVTIALLSLFAGALIVGIRAVQLVRASRRPEIVEERGLLERGWRPAWMRSRLDVYAILLGLAILGINAASGGLKQSPIEGSALGLAFYVLLAPIFLWLGFTLLAVRGLLALLARWARADRTKPIRSWWGAGLRWLGRRPARTGVALVLGILAVAFGTYVVSFVGTYRAAKSADAAAAFGSDLRLVPAIDPYAPDVQTPPPQLGPDITSTPIRFIPARAGSDRKTILTIDPASYQQGINAKVQMQSGQGPAALAHDPTGILLDPLIADENQVKPGDPFPITIFPDDQDKSRNLNFHVLGVFRSVPPSDPPAEIVMSNAGMQGSVLPPADFYLAHIGNGQSPSAMAANLRNGPVGHSFTVLTPSEQARVGQRSLTALNIGGLSTIEAVGAGLIAAIGVAVLGAFLVIERRRELAVLEAIGADERQRLTGPLQEGIVSVAGSLGIGIPLGLALSVLAVRVLGLFFVLPAPLLSVPVGQLVLFAVAMVAASAMAFGATIYRIRRVRAATVLREP